MTRRWNELVAILADGTPGGIFGLVIALILGATLVGVLWYTWPPRIPWLGRRRESGRRGKWREFRFRWPRFGRLRWRLPKLRWPWRRKRRSAPALDGVADDELPDIPAEVLALTADELAAAGRYAEAVRERLRAIVKELVERGVIEHRPGWTVTELAAAAARERPTTADPLRAAAGVFSGIWYGLLPATVEDDTRMRGYATSVHSALELSGVPT
jgi:hypothetical protein